MHGFVRSSFIYIDTIHTKISIKFEFHNWLRICREGKSISEILSHVCLYIYQEKKNCSPCCAENCLLCCEGFHLLLDRLVKWNRQVSRWTNLETRRGFQHKSQISGKYSETDGFNTRKWYLWFATLGQQSIKHVKFEMDCFRREECYWLHREGGFGFIEGSAS